MTTAKEQQPVGVTAEQAAAQQVETYLEEVEKKPEVDASIRQTLQPAPAGQPPLTSPIRDAQGQILLQNSELEPIVLPLGKEALEGGLHHRLMDSVRWLSEQCVMLIKKYPGRVFFKT